MSLERSNAGPESRLTTEVKQFLPRVIEDIRLGYEQNTFLSESTKQLITMALEVDAGDVASELADNLKQYDGSHTTEKKIRHFLNDRIMDEVAMTLTGTNREKERQALMLFLRYKVLDLNPLG